MADEGYLEIILGCMFSGKTTQIINLANKFKSINKKVLYINYLLDTRYGQDQIISHDQQKLLSINLDKLSSLKETYIEQYNSSEIICIDEAQFFPDLKKKIIEFCTIDKKHVIISGLNGDYKQEPFGQILDLIPHAEKVTKLNAFCKMCNNGKLAHFTKRIVKDNNTILIGGEESYLPVCRKHILD